ncbi:MAG TPA: hypothetical protein VFG55_00850 [Rhodanobacteraceae bacterium]|nr:hypothetical protein [Rhodanobacteraceae bacterium]
MADLRPAKAARRRRPWFVAIAIVAVLLVAGALALRHFARADQLTALLVGQVRTQLDAELVLGGEATFGFVPKLHLHLPQSALRGHAGSRPFLAADAVDVVVPWRTLWADHYVIERIELDRPRLDLDALDAWLAARPAGPGPVDLNFALAASDGVIVSGGKEIAGGVNLDLATAGDIGGWLSRIGTSSADRADAPLIPPLAGTAQAHSVQIGNTHLEGVEVEMRDGESAPAPRQPP